jgi:hypothetical protein
MLYTGRRQSLQQGHTTGESILSAPHITSVCAAVLLPRTPILVYIEGNIVRFVNVSDTITACEDTSTSSITLSEAEVLSKLTLSFAPIAVRACTSALCVAYSARDCCLLHFDSLVPSASSVSNIVVPLDVIDSSGNTVANNIVSAEWAGIDNILVVTTQRFVCILNTALPSTCITCQLPPEFTSSSIVSCVLLPPICFSESERKQPVSFFLVCLLSNSAVLRCPVLLTTIFSLTSTPTPLEFWKPALLWTGHG